MDEENNSSDWLNTCNNTRLMFILAALLAWSDGESPKYLYRQFGIHYALLSKLAEQISYLIEIAREIIPYQMELIYQDRNRGIFPYFNIDYETFIDAVNKKLTQIHNLFISVFYGVNTQIINEIQAYLQTKEPDHYTERVINEFSLHNINPAIARELRRIVIRYKFFAEPPSIDVQDAHLRNNFLDQYRQYKEGIKRWGPNMVAFFSEKFPDTFIKNPIIEEAI